MPYDPAFTPEKRRYLNVNVYSGFVRNNPNREQCRHPSLAEQSVTQAVVHPYSGLLASYKRNGLSLPTSPSMNGQEIMLRGKANPKRLQTITLDTVLK